MFSQGCLKSWHRAKGKKQTHLKVIHVVIRNKSINVSFRVLLRHKALSNSSSDISIKRDPPILTLLTLLQLLINLLKLVLVNRPELVLMIITRCFLRLQNINHILIKTLGEGHPQVLRFDLFDHDVLGLCLKVKVLTVLRTLALDFDLDWDGE